MKTSNRFNRMANIVKENYSFGFAIFTVFIALFLIVILTFGSNYNDARKNAVTVGSLTVTQEARQIEDAMATNVDALLLASYTVDSMIEHGAEIEEIRQYLVQETQGFLTGIDSEFSGIYGVVNDVYVDGIGWIPDDGYNPYERPWYMEAAAEKGELALVSPYLDAQSGSVMLSISKMLHDGKSAVSLDARLDNISEVIEDTQLSGSGYCFLTDEHGTIIAHRDRSQIGLNYLTGSIFDGSDERALMEKVFSASDEEMLLNLKLNNRKNLIFTHRVMDEWYVILVAESTDVFRNTQATLIQSVVASLFIFVVVGYFCTSNFINRKRAIRYAENIRIDVLTGLNNRGEFDRYLRNVMNELPSDRELYLLLFDADKFKQINDTYGHSEGDRALRIIAKTFMSVCHGTDWFCARYGGDEFVIICKSSDEALAKRVAEDVNEQLRIASIENNLPYTISLSSGCACRDSSVCSTTDLLDIADRYLYQAKKMKMDHSVVTNE